MMRAKLFSFSSWIGPASGAVGCLLAIGQVGCVSPPDRQSMPETVEVPGSWRSASDTNAVIAAWWTTFHAPQLVAVVNEAMVRNHDLQAALARMEAAAADARMAGADLYPRLDGGFDASRSRRNFIGFPIPGSGGNVLSTENNSFGLILSTSWEVDLWGRIRSGRRAALAGLQASQADYFALRQSIAAQAVKGWLAVVEQQRQVALSEQTAQAFERTARLIERRYERGLASSLDFRLARTDLESSRASLADRRALRERAVRQLQLLLGRYPDGLTEVQVEFP
ncbi:MAG TPA: hypothetical protein DCY13_04285, partial [Verrucomicrobiales bacterium]|nr:hypothetical protein [Verrucomicrobiales bacterium]